LITGRYSLAQADEQLETGLEGQPNFCDLDRPFDSELPPVDKSKNQIDWQRDVRRLHPSIGEKAL